MEKATEPRFYLALRAGYDGIRELQSEPHLTAGERRELDRAEIAEAEIDHVRNTLEIRGRVWCDVEVERKSSGAHDTAQVKR